MTLKASEGEGGGGMRTALSDLYLEHLLQKRSRPEVRGPRGVLGAGCGPRTGLQAAPPPTGPARSVAPAPEGPASEPRPRRLPGFVPGASGAVGHPPPPQPF